MEISDFDAIFNISYFVWMIGSLIANLSLRRMGYYAGRVLVESSIPAQIHIWSLAFLKITYLSTGAYIDGFINSHTLIIASFLVFLTFYVLANSFFT
jgi:hypothetical protein